MREMELTPGMSAKDGQLSSLTQKSAALFKLAIVLMACLHYKSSVYTDLYKRLCCTDGEEEVSVFHVPY